MQLPVPSSGFAKVEGFEDLQSRYFKAIASNHAGNSSCGLPRDDAFHVFRDPITSDLPWPGVLIGWTIPSLWYWCTDQVSLSSTSEACPPFWLEAWRRCVCVCDVTGDAQPLFHGRREHWLRFLPLLVCLDPVLTGVEWHPCLSCCLAPSRPPPLFPASGLAGSSKLELQGLSYAGPPVLAWGCHEGSPAGDRQASLLVGKQMLPRVSFLPAPRRSLSRGLWRPRACLTPREGPCWPPI